MSAGVSKTTSGAHLCYCEWLRGLKFKSLKFGKLWKTWLRWMWVWIWGSFTSPSAQKQGWQFTARFQFSGRADLNGKSETRIDNTLNCFIRLGIWDFCPGVCMRSTFLWSFSFRISLWSSKLLRQEFWKGPIWMIFLEIEIWRFRARKFDLGQSPIDFATSIT